MLARLLLAVCVIFVFVSPPPPMTGTAFGYVPPPPPPPPPPPSPPPSIVPGIQAMPPTMPMMPVMATPLLICSFCQDSKNESGVRACKRLADADRKVAEASRKMAPDEPNDFERGLTAARTCGGAAHKPGETVVGCDTWREAVKKRAKACTALEAREKDKPPQQPVVGADGKALPVIKSGAAEQVARRGRPLDLVGVVGALKDMPNVEVNGEPVELTEMPGGGASAGSVSRSFKISVPTGQAGTNIYVIEACEGTGNCFGRDLVVRVLE